MLSWWMIILLIIYVTICLLLMATILLQSGKGGGLSSLAGGSSGLSDAIGATGAEKMMNRVTTGVAVSFMLMAILLSLLGRFTGPDRNSEVFGSDAAQPAAREIPSMAPAETDEVPLEPVIPSELPELPVDSAP
jgi:preprotein translocase subunit SecG